MGGRGAPRIRAELALGRREGRAVTADRTRYALLQVELVRVRTRGANAALGGVA